MSIAKTEAGQQVLKDRSVALTPRQRTALIMLDGKRTLAQVLEATAAAGVTSEDIDNLVSLGLVAVTEAVAAPVSKRSTKERFMDAYPIATHLTAGLGLKGLRLNLAVEAASSYEELEALSPRIREAVGSEKFAPLDAALKGL